MNLLVETHCMTQKLFPTHENSVPQFRESPPPPSRLQGLKGFQVIVQTIYLAVPVYSRCPVACIFLLFGTFIFLPDLLNDPKRGRDAWALRHGKILWDSWVQKLCQLWEKYQEKVGKYEVCEVSTLVCFFSKNHMCPCSYLFVFCDQVLIP